MRGIKLIAVAAATLCANHVSAQGAFPSAAVPGGGEYVLYSESSLAIPTSGTSEEVLKTVTIPGGMLTPGGAYSGFTLFATISSAANTHAKSPRFRLGGISGTAVASHVNDAVSNNRFTFSCVFMVNSANTLDGQCNNSRVSGASYLFSPNIAANTYDFSGGIDVTITGETAAGAGDLILTSMRVALLRKGQ